jgi:hypothetical protein
LKSDSPPDTRFRRARPSASEFLDGQDFVPARNDVGAYSLRRWLLIDFVRHPLFGANDHPQNLGDRSAVCCLDTS